MSNYLLLETGDKFALEDGLGFILLEDAISNLLPKFPIGFASVASFKREAAIALELNAKLASSIRIVGTSNE